MAYVRMHQIKTTVGRAIKYITRESATVGGQFISTNAAVIDPGDWRAIETEFVATRASQVSRGAKGSVLAHHVIQSFKPGEVDSPGLAHEIGVGLAEKITQGQHEYVVATHLDKGHMHNHILINAVSHTHGRKFRVDKRTLASIRASSDALCFERSLSIIQRRDVILSEPIGLVYAKARGTSTFDLLKIAIDNAVGQSTTWAQYERALAAQGVQVARSQKRTITYRGPGMGRSVRDLRLGAGYAEEQVIARLGRHSVLRFDVDQSMVAHRDEESVTVKVPGTRGRRRIAVNASQVVMHGRTLRIYLPSEGTQAILDARGGIAATVPTRALYVSFTPPERALLRVYSQRVAADRVRGGSALRRDLGKMHAAESQLNARARYGVVSAVQAVKQAAELGVQLDDGMREIQTLAVALDAAPINGRERDDVTVRLSDAQNRCAALQSTAAALVAFARETERDADKQVRAMTLHQRLTGLSRRDIAAVSGRGVNDEEVVRRLDRAQTREERRAEEKPASWAEMTLKERTDWLRQRDGRQRRMPQRGSDDQDTSGRTRR